MQGSSACRHDAPLSASSGGGRTQDAQLLVRAPQQRVQRQRGREELHRLLLPVAQPAHAAQQVVPRRAVRHLRTVSPASAPHATSKASRPAQRSAPCRPLRQPAQSVQHTVACSAMRHPRVTDPWLLHTSARRARSTHTQHALPHALVSLRACSAPCPPPTVWCCFARRG